jgi:hypothetical protein
MEPSAISVWFQSINALTCVSLGTISVENGEADGGDVLHSFG